MLWLAGLVSIVASRPLTINVRATMGINQDFDEILTQLGDFGRYQIRHFFFISLTVIFCAMFTISYVFTAGYVPHRCLVEECGDVNEASPFLPSWWTEAIPPGHNGAPNTCSMYTPVNSTLSTTVATAVASSSPPPLDTCSVLFDNTSILTCDQWVYDGIERTILTEFQLTCQENLWKLTLVGTINNLGRLLGLPLIGYLSDRFGRKWALIATLLGASVMGLIRAISPTYAFFVTFEFLEAIFSGSTYGIAFIIAMELVSPNKRVVGGAVLVFSYAIGQAILGLIAWGLREWRSILFAIYAPALLFVFYIWLIPESVRWLMMRGRMNAVRKQIQKVADTNKIEFCAEMQTKLSKLESISESLKEEEEVEKGEPTIAALKQVCRSKRLLLRLANCSFCWATNALVYYGLSLNSVTLAGSEDSYLNFILVALVEAPGYLFVMYGMSKIGRRLTLCTALIVSGVACIAQPFVPSEISWAQLTLYLIGKLAITGAFDTLYVFTAEIFPTRLRTSMLSTCSMVGRIGSMIAPQTPLLSYVSPLLPMLLFGAVALLAGFLALLFPETRGQTLPDSVEEAVALGASSSSTYNTSTSESSIPQRVDIDRKLSS